jgi:hypothetical protein
MGRIELLARACASLDPQIPRSKPFDFYLGRELRSVVYANSAHDLEAVKQNIRQAIYSIQADSE